MSMPTIPSINSEINVSKEDALNVVLASIGFEELGLAHLINAEAEKVQFALGTLETADGAQSFDDILTANESASGVLKNAVKMQLLLGMKLDDALGAYTTDTSTTSTQTNANQSTSSTTSVPTATAPTETEPTETEPTETEPTTSTTI